MTDRTLAEKTDRYREMLEDALAAAEPIPASDADGRATADGTDLMTMARSYLEDGVHFLDEGEEADALAAFSYGHGWLDAGVRAGLIEADDPELFTVEA